MHAIDQGDGTPEGAIDEVSMPTELVLADPAAYELWRRIDRLSTRVGSLELRIGTMERSHALFRKALAGSASHSHVRSSLPPQPSIAAAAARDQRMIPSYPRSSTLPMERDLGAVCTVGPRSL